MPTNEERRDRQVHEVSYALELARFKEETTQEPRDKAVLRQLRKALEIVLDAPRAFGGTANPRDWE